MKFAMITTFYPPYHFGGDAIFIWRLTEALARRGHEVHVIHDVDAFRILAPDRKPEPTTAPERVTVHALESATHLGSQLSCLATQQTGHPIVHGARIRQILEEGDFDVIHYHNISLVGGPGVLAYGDAVKLYLAHEHWLVCPTHVLWRHNREVCDEQQCFRCVLHHRRPPQLWRHTGLLRRKSQHVDAFYSPSRFSADKHRAFGFERELEVIPYFLPDADSPIPAAGDAEDRPSERPYYLFVGRLEKIKGLQDVLPQFAGDEGPELWVVGSGDYESTLREMAREFPRVRFIGQLSPDALRSLYAGAIAVVVPSVCYETFGIIVLEAFREATPVIARRLGPLPEIVESSGGGLLFETDQELSDALSRLSEDPSLRQDLGEAGHRALQEHWSEGVVLKKYYELIYRIAEEKKPSLARQMAVDGLAMELS